MSVDADKVKRATRMLLEAIGEDPRREGLKDTPARIARFWQEFIDYEPGNLDTTFEDIQTDQMVTVTGVRLWSLCEHHLLPFWCDVSIGYIARDRVIGLSKLARIAHGEAHRLQVQERLVHAIADRVSELTRSPDVGVIASGEHLCMTMRGIKTPATMNTSVMRGLFFFSQQSREEFLRLTR